MNRIPLSTYRLQLSDHCNFAAIGERLDYFQQLGITDLYLSPLFRSRASSTHGYDVVSHTEIEPSFGDTHSFEQLARDVRGRGMGIIVDVVPNHMGINDPQNSWWLDVLANGPLSHFAGCFDIDWDRSDEKLRNKLLLPLLGDYFGDVLERGELKLEYQNGGFCLCYAAMQFPLNSFSYGEILNRALSQIVLVADADSQTEFESIITQFKNLPGREVLTLSAAQERTREYSVATQRLTTLVTRAPAVGLAIQQALDELNGQAGVPSSFDQLEKLLAAQWYRLAYWRVAADEINYRRFFDINDLAAIRVELPQVFEHVHRVIFRLLAQGHITGLRIDHPDGLFDPHLYFDSLQREFHQSQQDRSDGDALFVVVEKILSDRELLPDNWPVAGTTGYEFLNMLSQVLVDGDGLPQLKATFETFVGEHRTANDILYESKRQILHDSFASELTMLASRLHRIAQSRRKSCDFTFPSLLRALREVIACFPVYRTYVRCAGWEVDPDDLGRIAQAVRMAKRRNPSMPRAVFDFVSAVLTLSFPPELEKREREAWREFTLRFQQVTGPVTAKGVEDTAFYRYLPLASLNEVGGEIKLPSIQPAEFHRLMKLRCEIWPHGLSATATHDTKRGEDTRARLHVLSEVPDEWQELLLEYDRLADSVVRDVEGQRAPDNLELYLLLQTLVGTWPNRGHSPDAPLCYGDRICEYMTKAMREAKRNTSWLDPSPEYEEAVSAFVRELLDDEKSPQLMALIDGFVNRIAPAGQYNSLSQLVLKATLPGVPDFYQGCELWDFSLVDPDNRRQVDFEERQRRLAEIKSEYEAAPKAYMQRFDRDLDDSSIKLFVTWRLLSLRRQFEKCFTDGSYLPLELGGKLAAHGIAFARLMEGDAVVVFVPRCVQGLFAGKDTLRIDWGDTYVDLPSEMGSTFRCFFAGDTDKPFPSGKLKIASLKGPLPFAILISSQSLVNV